VWPVPFDLPGYHPVTRPHSRQVREAARMMMAAQRPVLYVGGGVIKAGASADLCTLAELTGMPVVTTLMARGAFPDSHPLCLGMPGMHGNYTAVTAMQQSDLLIALGSRFDDRVTGKVGAFAPDAKIIHVDVDPAELGKIRRPDVPIVGDCRPVIEEIVKAVAALGGAAAQPDRSAWMAQIREWQARYPLTYTPAAGWSGPWDVHVEPDGLVDMPQQGGRMFHVEQRRAAPGEPFSDRTADGPRFRGREVGAAPESGYHRG